MRHEDGRRKVQRCTPINPSASKADGDRRLSRRRDARPIQQPLHRTHYALYAPTLRPNHKCKSDATTMGRAPLTDGDRRTTPQRLLQRSPMVSIGSVASGTHDQFSHPSTAPITPCTLPPTGPITNAKAMRPPWDVHP
jgi:hypothetical protein